MPRIGIQPLSQMLQRVGMSIHAGIALLAIWDKETMRGSQAYRQQAKIVRDRIAAGDTFSEAMAACGDYFPPLVRDLADVGEKTGRLDEVLLGLSNHYSHLVSLRRTFLIGIAWPSLQLLMALGVIGLLIFVLGVIGSGPSGEPIDILGFGLVGGKGLVVYIFLVCFVLAGGVLAVTALLRGWFGPAPLQAAMKTPAIGGYLRTSALARFAWTLSLTLEAGLDARRAMQLSLRSTQNPYYMSSMAAIDQSLMQGREFHESLRLTGIFPDAFLDELEAAEIAGTPGESMGRLAEDYRTRATNAAAGLTMVATVAVWVAVAAFIIFMIFRLAAFYIGTINDALNGI